MPVKTPSTEEARQRGKKGDIASGEAKRKKMQLRDTLLTLLDTKEPIKRPDGSKEDVEAREAISLALIHAALAGDVKAFVTISDTIVERLNQVSKSLIIYYIASPYEYLT